MLGDLLNIIEKFGEKKILVNFFGLISILIPGFMYLYLFNNKVFIAYDGLKFIFLLIYYSLPIVLINIIVSTTYFNLGELNKKKELTQPIFLFSFFTVYQVYASLIIYYIILFFNWTSDKLLSMVEIDKSFTFHIDFIYIFYGFPLIVLAFKILEIKFYLNLQEKKMASNKE